MVSKKTFFILLVVLSTIHISESNKDENDDSNEKPCPCSHNSRSQMNDKKNLVSKVKTEKILRDILLWLHSSKIKPQKGASVKKKNRFPKNLQITSGSDKEENFEFLNKLVLEEIGLNNLEKESTMDSDKSQSQVSKQSQKTLKNPKLRYHFAPSPQIIPRDEHKLDDKIGTYPKKDLKSEHLLPLDKNFKLYAQLDINVPDPQVVPLKKNKQISQNNFDVNKIHTHHHVTNNISEKVLNENNLSKNVHNLDYIPPFLKISERDGLIRHVSDKYKIDKHQSQVVEPLQDDVEETIAYGSESHHDLITKFLENQVQKNDKSIPQDIDNEGFHHIQDLKQGPVSINPEMFDDEESKHISLNDKSNVLNSESNQIPVHQKHGKFKYITRSNYVSDVESEAIPPSLATNTKVIPDKAKLQGQKIFRKWILKQITKINNHRKDEQDKIDSKDVENSLLRILSQNGMSVTAKGMLIDSDGSVLDIHTLNLIPILVQDSVYLEKLLKKNGGVLSQNTKVPYLHGILVKSTNPSKILGVIPVKKTYLPLSVVSGREKVNRTKKRDLDEVDELENGDDAYQLLNKLNAGSVYNEELVWPGRRYVLNSPTTRAFNVLTEEKNDVGRILLPNLDSNVELFSKRQQMPLTITRKESQDSGEFDISKLLQDLLIELDYDDKSGVKDPRNAATEIPDPLITSKGFPISNTVGLNSDSKTLTKLSLLDMLSGLKDFYIMGRQLGANRKSEINVPLTTRMQDVRFDKTETGKSIPLKNLESILETQNQKAPELFSAYESRFLSRSGTLPGMPPENNSNGVDSLDVFLENENDDDDGDFRIIGGNAATGSGTPLSNRGRSGRILG